MSMNDPICTIRIDDTHRVKVMADDSPSNPRIDAEMYTGALTVRRPSRTIDVEPVYEFPGNLRRADDQLYGMQVAGWGGDTIAVERWARIFYGIELDYRDGTYWWVDPKHLAEWTPVGQFKGTPLYKYGAGPKLLTAAELQHQIIASEQINYEQWGAGEVYGLVVEEFKLKVKVHVGIDERGEPFSLDEYLPSGDAEDYWVEQDAVWGFYLDPNDETEIISEACSIIGIAVPEVV